MKSVALEIEGVGAVMFQRSRRARHLNIRIQPFAGVRVSVPTGMSFTAAQAIVTTKRDWIKRNLRKVTAVEKRSVIYDGTQVIQTREHTLDVQPGRRDRIQVRLLDGWIRVRYPSRLAITDRRVQTAIKRGLLAAYRKEAKAYLPKRLAYLAKKHGFKYNQVFIKNHRSRWGSCSTHNNINLNLHLMRLPDHLIDYVLLHELVHTRIRSHGPEFWALLEKVYPDVQAAKKMLRKMEVN